MAAAFSREESVVIGRVFQVQLSRERHDPFYGFNALLLYRLYNRHYEELL